MLLAEKFHFCYFDGFFQTISQTISLHTMDLSYLILLHTANASIIEDAASQPLIRPDTNNVSPTMLQEGLKLQQ